MNRILAALIVTFFFLTSFAENRNWIAFNENWLFSKGNPQGAEKVDFDDSRWESVNVPHDWAISGPFNEAEPGHTGKLPWKGEGWYRNTFKVDKANLGKLVYFLFDGIMAFPKIYVNGTLAGQWDYGYNSFYLEVSDLIRFGEENTIAVYVDTRKHGSRWYPGAGIYRKVRMLVTDPVHSEIWGTYITTPVVEKTHAEIRVLNNINNFSNAEKEITVEATILSPDGIEIASSETKKVIAAGTSRQFDHWMQVVQPSLWDVDNPVLYSLKTVVKEGEKVTDVKTTSFGFRTFEFTAADGFHLNGRRVQLKGVNLHHDHGPLGAAFNYRSMERKLEIMKEMGVNAIRTSHNIEAPEVLELCDKLGLIVFNEAFDKWDDKADITPETDFYEFGERNIRNFVKRDRNHPSVVIWSVGNEMGDIQTNSDYGLQKLAAMVGFVRKYDITRPVTMACDQDGNAKWRHFDYYDVHSWNYDQRWEPAHKLDPSKSVVISESASTVSTRGFYELPLPAEKTDFTESEYVSSYDLNAPYWAEIPDDDFMWQEEGKYIAGEFVWTGFDYLGEPTPYMNSRSSYFGIVDLVGIPKDRFYLYQSYWRPEKNMVHILPHWNWKGREGEKIPVFVYTNGDGAELFLNGKSLGKKFKNPTSETSIGRYRLMWSDVVFEPGELKAVGYKAGKVVGEDVVRTAGKPHSVKLSPDRTILNATGDDLSFVLVEVFDKDGNPCPLADNLINFEIDGPAEIAGVGNGDQRSYEPFRANYRKLFNGKAMLIIRSQKNTSGSIVVKATSRGLSPAKVELTSQ
ncbi:beta-galactosidase [Mariniphaga anaerophila]|uniref:Beta-galactosidase n=1 Tax=Mariniphaga anaerophila TaxID=1484053 RepID=A0A1M4T5Q9_9BACT|nr:glycoside hydrolase family 2 TIM barrel-domain containing protein [Mariniphaga anaerophila]SHE39836.1 beta-galactosidase [Mariniphaga anaerophila]